MPRTIESILENRRAAQARRAAGRPVWDLVIYLGSVFRVEGFTFEGRRDLIVEIIRESGWVDNGDGSPLDRELDDLADTIDVEEFDDMWDQILDRADADRVFIDTVSRAP